MSGNGERSTDLAELAFADDLIGNYGGNIGRFPLAGLKAPGLITDLVYDDPAALIASAETYRGSGALWQTKQGYKYIEAPVVVVDEHLITSGGVKLYISGEINLMALGAAADGVTDDGPVLEKAMDVAVATGRYEVFVPAGSYVIHQVAMRSGIKFRGTGYERNVSEGVATKGGAIFTRTAAVPILEAIGSSVRSAAHAPLSAMEFEGIMFDGAEYVADLFTMRACTTGHFSGCMFTRCAGARWLELTEVWDTVFEACRFEQGGSSDGTVPGLEMISGADGGGTDWERTNHIHFSDCTWENFPGTAIKTTSREVNYYSNEIYFAASKVESRPSDQPLVDFEDARTVYLGGLQVTAMGTPATALAAPIRISGSSGIVGAIQAEFITGGADWSAFVNVETSSDVDLLLRCYGAYAPTSGYAVETDGNNSETMHFRAVGSFTSFIADQPSRIGESILISRSSGEPQLQFKRGDINDAWALGRLTPDGSGTKFRIMHGLNEVVGIQNDNKAVFNYPVRAKAFQADSYTVAQLSAGISGQTVGMSVYCSNESGGAIPAFFDGTNWRRMSDRAIVS